MHDDPAAGGSPNLPERLPLETVRALAVRQMTSPRQKKPSMEEAVNRARIAKQLFGEPLPSPPLPPQPPQRSSGRSSQEPTSYLGLSAAAAVGEHHNRLYSAYAGSQPPSSPHALAIGNGSPQTSRLMPMTPGSTDASPMPELCKRALLTSSCVPQDLFFTRPRRLWGPPVTLPSRNGEEGQLRSNTCIVDHLPYDTRRSKDSGESAPSTRIVSTSDESSRDVHGHVEIATPNFSQNGGGGGGGGGANHHDRSRFPAISEEERPNSTSSDRIIRINGNEDDNETTFHDHRWMQKGFLPRDASSNTILNFHEVEARRPEEPRRASNMVEKLGDTSFTPDRTSVVPESGRLDDSSDNDSADSLAVFSNKDGRKGFLAPFLVPPPEVAHNDSAYSSASDINSFVSARSAATIKASHSEHPAVSRQNTDMTTMSYATANSKPL
ncbi:hypothetical protein QFC19_007474 [Naganishia cerealis]|uniref:Uncharacterized protein n=1 Tax=Naganishia cerealis TaxID=610337 RepID=A0ACC2VA69_9TREE|nr:hypothetical protein QFC19_007474 [Naganishia cerealis]